MLSVLALAGVVLALGAAAGVLNAVLGLRATWYQLLPSYAAGFAICAAEHWLFP